VLRLIIKCTATTLVDECVVTTSPDTLAAALIWLCSAVVLDDPLPASDLKVMSSPKTTQTAINKMLQLHDFMAALTQRLPSDMATVCNGLVGTTVSLALVPKKKS